METDLLGWEIERGGLRAVVLEDGEVRSEHASLRDFLLQRLQEPVTVFRRGTVRGEAGAAGLVLQPGDRRHVVARIRDLAEREESVEIIGIVWSR